MTRPSVEIDLTSVQTPIQLHLLLASALHLPDHYGLNWESFLELASEAVELPCRLVLRAWGLLTARLPGEAGRMREAFDSLGSQRWTVEYQ